MHRPLEASRIGLLVIKTVCCFHHSNLTHSVRLNGMRLMLLLCSLSIVCRLRISVRKQTHLYECFSKDVLNWSGIKIQRNNTHRSCGKDKSKNLQLFWFIFLPLVIFGCFMCIGECTTTGILSEWIFSCYRYFYRKNVIITWFLFSKKSHSIKIKQMQFKKHREGAPFGICCKHFWI